MPTACIAVIDVDQPTSELMGEVLTDAGYRVALWSPDEDPVAFVERTQPDLVILDPRLTQAYQAEAVITALCGTGARVTRPVIIYTADGIALDRDHATYAQRGCATLEKPFDLDDLVVMVRQQLSQVTSAS